MSTVRGTTGGGGGIYYKGQKLKYYWTRKEILGQDQYLDTASFSGKFTFSKIVTKYSPQNFIFNFSCLRP